MSGVTRDVSSRSVAAAAGVTSVLFRAESCSTVQRDLTHCVPRLSWTLGSLPPPGRGASRGCAQGCGGICLTQPFKDGHILRSRGRNSHIWILTGPQVGVAAAETGDHTLGLETGRGRARWRAEDKTEVGGGGGGHGRSHRGGYGEPHVLTRFLRAGPLPRPPGRRAVSPPRWGPSRALGRQAALPSWQLRGPGSPASPRPAGQAPRPWPLCSRAPLTRPGPPGSFPS